jgi:hypothetical protein
MGEIHLEAVATRRHGCRETRGQPDRVGAPVAERGRVETGGPDPLGSGCWLVSHRYPDIGIGGWCLLAPKCTALPVQVVILHNSASLTHSSVRTAPQQIDYAPRSVRTHYYLSF